MRKCNRMSKLRICIWNHTLRVSTESSINCSRLSDSDKTFSDCKEKKWPKCILAQYQNKNCTISQTLFMSLQLHTNSTMDVHLRNVEKKTTTTSFMSIELQHSIRQSIKNAPETKIVLNSIYDLNTH